MHFQIIVDLSFSIICDIIIEYVSKINKQDSQTKKQRKLGGRVHLIFDVKIFCDGKQVSEEQFLFLSQLNYAVWESCAFGKAFMNNLVYSYADVEISGRGDVAYVFFAKQDLKQFVEDAENYLKLLQ